MKTSGLKNRKRAVAPVIATLLMVAIAVVGGMLVFVFAQDFFTATDSMTGPTIEIIQLFGYDARDHAVADDTLRNHAGTLCSGAMPGTKGGTLEDLDNLTVFVRNLGANDVIIGNVSVYNVKLDQSAVTTAAIGVLPGTWTVLIDEDCVALTVASAANVIKPGRDATILIGAGIDATPTAIDFSDIEVKAGRPIFLKVETSSGNIFTKQMVNGRAVG